jgi:hypothetical protein
VALNDDEGNDREEADEAHGEPRLAATLTILAASALPLLMPPTFVLGPKWLFPLAILSLLGALAVADPGRINRRSAQIRALATTMLVLLVLAAAFSTARLIDHLVNGSAALDDGQTLLRVGGIVWLDNCFVFALLYWQLDRGGPAVRAHHLRKYPDLAFVEDVNPELAPPGWRPTFVDYLYLSITNALAFSPTDTMPLARWAKLSMAVQSLISLALLGLVVARAVNILQ